MPNRGTISTFLLNLYLDSPETQQQVLRARELQAKYSRVELQAKLDALHDRVAKLKSTLAWHLSSSKGCESYRCLKQSGRRVTGRLREAMKREVSTLEWESGCIAFALMCDPSIF